MSLNPNGGQEETPERKKQDELLLPLDFPEGTQQGQPQRKPIPLGSFMKKSEASGDAPQERKPIPLAAKKPQDAPPAQQERKPIPLTPRKAEAVPVPPPPPPATPSPSKPVEAPQPIALDEAAPTIRDIPLPKPVEAEAGIHKAEAAPTAKDVPLPKPVEAAPSPVQPKTFDEFVEPPPAKHAPPEERPRHAEAAPRPKVHDPRSQDTEPKRHDTHPRSFSEKRPLQSLQKAPSAQNAAPARPKRKPVKLGGGASLQNSSLGQILQEARVASGLSLIQVEQLTRIKRDYLEGLECDDTKRLPPPVFVSAYIRTLSSIYNMDPDDAGILMNKLKGLASSHELPEKLMQSIEKEGQLNSEEDLRVRKLMIFAAAGFLSLVSIGLLWYGLWHWKHSSAEYVRPPLIAKGAPGLSPAPAASFRPEQLDRFVIVQSMSMREMKLPADSRKAPAR